MSFPAFGQSVEIRTRSIAGTDCGVCPHSLSAAQKPLGDGTKRPRVHLLKEKKMESTTVNSILGPSVEIRTRGLLNPIQARYHTSPHPDILLCVPRRLSILAHLNRKCKHYFYFFPIIFQHPGLPWVLRFSSTEIPLPHR